MTAPENRRSVLRVYITPGCLGCESATQLAEAVRRLRPHQPVELVDLTATAGPVPPDLVGTPTYRLGERTLSLGNPALAELLGRLDTPDADNDGG